jgi:hypothetical protein
VNCLKGVYTTYNDHVNNIDALSLDCN